MPANDSRTTRTSAPYQIEANVDPYVTDYRQQFASCAFSFPLSQQCSSRFTCHGSNEPEHGEESGFRVPDPADPNTFGPSV